MSEFQAWIVTAGVVAFGSSMLIILKRMTKNIAQIERMLRQEAERRSGQSRESFGTTDIYQALAELTGEIREWRRECRKEKS